MTELTTARLHMRPFTLGDDINLARLHGDKDVMAYMRGGVQSHAEAAAELAGYVECWAERGFGIWALFIGRAFIGECGFWLRPGESLDVRLRFVIAKPYWGRGLAGEAVEAALGYAFGGVDIRLIRAVTQDANPASRRVLERAGMTLETHFLGDRGAKLSLYAITAEAWTASAN